MSEVIETLGVVEVLGHLSQDELQAIAAKFAAQPKSIKKLVRELQIPGEEYTQYAVWILKKLAVDYINAQMRDVWIQRLEMLIPRVTTKDEKLKQQTESAIAQIASEVTDVDMRGELIVKLKASLLPKSTDAYTLLKAFERTEELFKSVWK